MCTKLTTKSVPRMILFLSILSALPAEGYSSGGGEKGASQRVTQQKKGVLIKGVVRDDLNEAVISATIQEEGNMGNGAITDIDGNFSIEVSDPSKAVLVVNYIGYSPLRVPVKNQKNLSIVLSENVTALEEVTVVAYGVQKKETLTGAISAVKTDALTRSPNASVANTLAGQVTGISTVQTSGQPGLEDPAIFVRGMGSLSESASQPLIMVDGVERPFFQMDPNEIESVTVLKDASATAVFGVRGANGVILVTTRRGEKGKAKISLNSSFGVQMPTRIVEMADSYTYATLFNEREVNDGRKEVFTPYMLDRFRLGDDPIMFPDIKWREYLMKETAIQTQHNMNISGGTDDVRYFISMGFLYQDGLFKQFDELDYNNNFNYKRYNYRANIDYDITKTTLFKINLGGIVADRHEPAGSSGLWSDINDAQPFVSSGVIDGYAYQIDDSQYGGAIQMRNPLSGYYDRGYTTSVKNTLNIDLALSQKLDMITKGLSVEVKGSYNTTYTFDKERLKSAEMIFPYYKSQIEDPNLDPSSPEFDHTIVHQITGQEGNFSYGEATGRGRNWYFEASARYGRKFGRHNVNALLLYNQDKTYYPSQFVGIPSAYVGFVCRATYDYASKYMVEFNMGINGSENFAPNKRYGVFPAGSIGYILTEEGFMKDQSVFDYLKLRASIGLVGNDNMSSYRFLYLPDAYNINLTQTDNTWKHHNYGYNFGFNSSLLTPGAQVSKLGNPDVTWEKSLKQNYGIDMYFLDSRLKINADYFREYRSDILINRNTIPSFTGLTPSMLPAVNMGKVKNHGYEVEMKWGDTVNEFRYWIEGNVSYAKNEIVEMDEVPRNEPYMYRTGHQVGAVFGRVCDGFYQTSDFEDPEKGILKEHLPKPTNAVFPGDAIYRDLNEDGVIDSDDETYIGYSSRPNYVFGLNLGFNYKGFTLSMNWAGAAERSLALGEEFSRPFSGSGRALMQYHVDTRWTEATAATAEYPRFSTNSAHHNNVVRSTIWVMDGSYIKLKNLSVGYNFAKLRSLKRVGIQQLGLKFTGYNLLTFDSFKIMDPESKPNQNDTYPVTKIFNLGVNITF